MQQPRATALTDGHLAAAFPEELAGDVRAVLDVMPQARIAPVSPFSVHVGDATVAIPYRIYHEQLPVDVARSLTDTQAAISCCLYSRHSDGLVRQRHLERIVGSDEPWVVPYVVQLVGEYVLEILQSIHHGLSDLLSAHSAKRLAYGDFIARNPEFFARTERRVVSYWSCYHRWRFPAFGTYPGCQLLELLRAAAADRTGRPWPRHTPA